MLFIQLKMQSAWFSSAVRSGTLGGLSLSVSTRLGRGVINRADFSRLDRKCAALMQFAELTQLRAKDISGLEQDFRLWISTNRLKQGWQNFYVCRLQYILCTKLINSQTHKCKLPSAIAKLRVVNQLHVKKQLRFGSDNPHTIQTFYMILYC